MGIFTQKIVSLNGGESVTLDAPSGKSSINKIYITSTNLTYANVVTDEGVNQVQKSANTNYAEGYWPLQQPAAKPTITVFGPSTAENVTIIIEWV